MNRLFKAACVLFLILTLAFLAFWVTSLLSCASEAQRYMQLQYPPPCEVSTLEESERYAILRIACPGEAPFTKKVRKR